MKIDIASRDERYLHLCALLNKNGYTASIVLPNEVSGPNVLILPIKPEHTEEELLIIANQVSKNTIVLCNGDESIRKKFKNEIFDYSKIEYFLKENARITAEAFLSVWQDVTDASLYGKKILISGYGRIGKFLSKILSDLGAEIHVFARREETRNEIKNNGFHSADLEYSMCADAIINTVPSIIFKKDLIAKIPESTYLFELASTTGFEETKRVFFALGLPGKILPKSAGEAIFNTITPYLG